MPHRTLLPLLLLLVLALPSSANNFSSFYQAKKHLSQQVNDNTRTLYCNCSIKKHGKKLVPDAASCGYSPRLILAVAK